MYRLLIIKRITEGVFLFPFILIGRLIAYLVPLKQEYRVFYFFSFYHTGGAEKIHAQIVNAAGNSDCIIFFTRRSSDKRFLDDFKRSGCTVMDVSAYTDNKWLYFLNLAWRGIISGYINRQKKSPVVFNGQCNFAYKISPWLSKKIRQIELIHSLNSFSYIRIPFIPFISETIMISKKRIEDHKQLYKRYRIPDRYVSRIRHIPNAIELSPSKAEKPEQFTVLFVGRNSPEKRLHLFLETATRTRRTDPSIRFIAVGHVPESIVQSHGRDVNFAGNITDESRLNTLYAEAHVLMLCSSEEGFPLVIMEAMAQGCAVLATAVGDIPYHVRDHENGFLFSSISDKQAIVREATEQILRMAGDRQFVNLVSENNRNHANHNFAIGKFNEEYRNLLFMENNQQ